MGTPESDSTDTKLCRSSRGDHAQYRKRSGFFYQSLIRAHARVRWMTITTASIAYEDERTALGMDYAEAVLIIRQTMAHPNGHLIEVTEVKAPANRYEVGYHRELADDPDADFTPQELSDNGSCGDQEPSPGRWSSLAT